MSADDPLPGVPDIANPRSETPATAEFETGTANDPPLHLREAHAGGDGRTGEPGDETDGDGAGGSADLVSLTVDGERVAVPAESTLLDAVAAAGSEVPALCQYDRDTEAGELIGPRSTCRTCVVETDEGLVPACSHPVEAGQTVRTDAPAAAEAREVNLDLVLSNHNVRCTACGKNGDCELQDAAIESGVHEPRYGVFDDRGTYEPVDDSSAVIQIDRNKCILCNRCVEACNDVQVEGVLRIEGTGADTRVGFQSGAETMADSTCVSCGHCATVCPTGSLIEQGLTEATTLPLPGYNQKTSVGSVIEREPVETADAEFDEAEVAEKSGVARMMARARRRAGDAGRAAGREAFRRAEHTAEDLVSKVVPEGWLFDAAKAIGEYRKGKLTRTETTCGYCAVGCRFDVIADDEEVLGVRATGPDDAPANDFSTCVKGKFGYDFTDDEDRLTTPLVREDGRLREASWAEAYRRVVSGFEAIREESGPDALACFASSKCTNEEDYLMQKFARQVLGTKNVDNCARLCHSSTVAGLLQTVGYGAMSNSIADVADTDCYLITGSNTTESHPVLATRIKQNVREGADLFVFDPRKIDLAEHADQYTRTEPGYDVAWINGLVRYILEHDLHDGAFVEGYTRNFAELREKVEPFTPEEVERLAGVPPEDLANAAETIAAADSCVFGWAMGTTQHSHGTQNVLALANLALVTGHVGKPNAGLSPFRGHNNVQGGGGDVGTLPNTLPGYQDVTDDGVLDAFEAAWGERPPGEVGLKVPEVFEAAKAGDVRGLYVMGENPALSEPAVGDARSVMAEDLDFLVVQDVFPTETTEHADVVLPAASFAEKEGTFTNTERRVQRVREALEPPGEARQDWRILQDLANRMGYDWEYDHPAEIMDELADLSPIYGGISYDRLEREGGLQWPCPDEDHPGTRFLYEDGFNFPDGKARFVPADLGEPGELPDEEYPLTLSTGRVLYHFHTGTLTRRVEGSVQQVPESFVEINPETAERLGVRDGQRVRVESRRGSITVRAEVSDRPGPGVVFVPMHFADGAANALTQEGTVDPISGIPEYKVASVRVTPVLDESAAEDAVPSE